LTLAAPAFHLSASALPLSTLWLTLTVPMIIANRRDGTDHAKPLCVVGAAKGSVMANRHHQFSEVSSAREGH